MTTISDSFANSRAFKKAVSDATKFSTDDFSFLRAYFESEKHNPSFEFKWLDKIGKGGLSREHVLSIIYGHGADSSHEPPPSTPKKRQPRASPVGSPKKQRTKTPPPKDADRSEPDEHDDTEHEPEPETPKAVRKTTTMMTPPKKYLRNSKKEALVVDHEESDTESDDTSEDED
ncbi:hypothetical protein DSLPV1_051 [Dishui lake phycodnavirus 1]|uniref:hypothetical protein n=1 Tax=Dishui lake phycodnavirus 1 TaxID=2079134 RepID=UPI000CD69C25|nr:hypothetical protein C5Y57_gp051 [Dishui lake phycodnavirus 1]AUT19022.1 hypothetical protein DSLPV1_051 [Dishui lake phycodnavirus 1]